LSITVIYKFACLAVIFTVLLPEPQNILHIKQTGLLSRQPFGGTHGTSGKCRATGSFVGNLYALTFSREQHRVITDNISSAHSGKPYGLGVAGTGLPFAAIHSYLLEVATQGSSNRLSQRQGCA
jgi:hypothetical protein